MTRWLSVLTVAVARLVAGQQPVPNDKLPAPASRLVDFDSDVRPIFEKSCFQCHGGERPKSRFRLDDREAALKGGLNYGDDLIPGNSTNSRLILIVADLDPEIVMPPPSRFEPLTSEEIGILRAWIDQGAQWSFQVRPMMVASVMPAMRWVGVSGNASRFREVEGMTEGWSGGIGHFMHREQLSAEDAVVIEGHAWFGEENYRLAVARERRDVGFIRGGLESWREFYDDVGGYAANLPTNTFRLNRDLYLDLGRLWFDAGFTPPDGPEVVLGYEYQFRNGEKSTLQWGAVGTLPPLVAGGDAKSVYPAYKDLDEHTHVLKLDLRYTLLGWELEDNARIEWHELATSRRNVVWDSFGQVPNVVALVDEAYRHTQGANVLNARKQLNDWLSVSSGYLYSRLDGNASLNQSTVDGNGAFLFGSQWQGNRIDLSRESQVLSLASVLGPWSGLAVSLGVQGEWTQQESMGQEDLRTGVPGVFLFPDPSMIVGNLDSRRARETALLRWSSIPFTVISAEARLLQEDLGRFESRFDEPLNPSGMFTRDTDATTLGQDYRVGFTTSPWPRLSFGAEFRHRDKDTDYDQIVHDPPTQYLYPGFILWRNVVEDQIDARLVYRVNGWLRTSLSYRRQQSDFSSATGPIPVPMEPSAGGPLEAAQVRANIYSINAVLTPTARLHLSETLVYSDSRTATAQNGVDYLVPWEGDVYSSITAATYLLAPATTLNVSYAFSMSDYGQDNFATGLPAGVDYDRHALQLALSHEFAGQVRATAGYGFYQYREPTLGGAADYRAHSIFASVNFPLQ